MATILQRKAAEAVANGSAKTIKDAMLQAGYSPKTAAKSNKLKRTKGWQELAEQFLSDKLLAKRHNELLNVPKKVRHYKKGELVDEYEELDSQAIAKGLDMAYKLKGRYAPEKSVNVNIDIEGELTAEDKALVELIREHDRNPRTEAIPPTGDIPVGLDTQPQNQNV